MSGSVEPNPGPLNQDLKIKEVLLTVDIKPFEVDDWNTVVIDCKSLAAKWEQLSIYLGLSCDVIDNIKASGDNYHCWSQVLKQWIKQNYNTEKFGVPCWRTLLKAVAEVDKLQFKKLAAEHQATNETCQSDKASETSNNESKTTAESVITSAESLPLELREQLNERRSFESQEMIFKFQKLFTATKKSLRDEKVSVAELVGHLECLGCIKPTFKDSDFPSLRHQLPGLAHAKTIDAVMSVVKDYCSFFNYDMLEHIIEEFGTKQDKENMASYKEDFNKYAKCCITHCPSEVGKMNEQGFINLLVILDGSFDNCTVSHLNVFRCNLRKILNIPSNIMLRLCRIGPGSIKLIFQILQFVQQAIFPLSNEQEVELSSLGVVQLSCGDYQFTRQHTKEGEATDEDSDFEGSDTTVDADDAELASMDTGLAICKPGDTSSIRGGSSLSVVSTKVTQFSEDLIDRESRELETRMWRSVGGKSTWDELHLASQRGDLKSVIKLTEDKQMNPLQTVGKYGKNALHYAARYGQLEVLKYFIEARGCNPASQDNRTWTPLHYAALYKHLDVACYLVAEQGMDPLCCADNGTTPLHAASQAGDINAVRYLVNELSRLLPLKNIVASRGIGGKVPIHYATLEGHFEIVKYFITELNCDPNIATPVEYQGRTTEGGGRIALHGAAQGGHLRIVKYLIMQCNCNPSHMDNERVTPLHLATQWGHIEIVKYLTLEQHCDPLCTNKKNDTPLHHAARRGHLKLVKFFIRSLCCSPDIKGQHNGTPLDMARSRGHHHVVQYLESIHPKLSKL